MRRMYKRFAVLAAVLGFCLIGGCSMFDTSDKKISDMDFTVADAEELPEEIRTMIEERKNEAFQMAYHDGTYSYIIVGIWAAGDIGL